MCGKPLLSLPHKINWKGALPWQAADFFSKAVKFLVKKKKEQQNLSVPVAGFATDITNMLYNNTLCRVHYILLTICGKILRWWIPQPPPFSVSHSISTDDNRFWGLCPSGCCLKTHLSQDMKKIRGNFAEDWTGRPVPWRNTLIMTACLLHMTQKG